MSREKPRLCQCGVTGTGRPGQCPERIPSDAHARRIYVEAHRKRPYERKRQKLRTEAMAAYKGAPRTSVGPTHTRRPSGRRRDAGSRKPTAYRVGVNVDDATVWIGSAKANKAEAAIRQVCRKIAGTIDVAAEAVVAVPERHLAAR